MHPSAAAPDPDELHAHVEDALYRELVDSIPDYGIFVLDPDGMIRTWNMGAQRINGYSADEIIGRHFSTFYTPERVAEGWPQHELTVARAAGRFEDEGWRVRKDGSRFWANIVLSRLSAPDGTLLGFAKVIRDLSVRREQEELLRQSEERFRLLVEGVRDYAIFLLDPQGRVATWNAGAQQAKGYLAEEIIGQHFSVFYPQEVRDRGWPEHELEVALAEGRIEDEGWRVRKDGSRFWANVVITALHDSHGRHIGFAKVTRDWTDKRRVSALEDEGRRVTTFLAMLGHELRNPLAPIANAVSIMQLEPMASERLRLCRDIIGRQVAQLTRLVDDLLDVGRITAGKIRMDFAPLDLDAALAEAMEIAAPAAQQRGHVLTLAAAGAPVWVNGDRPRLIQVASNLLGNAIKFTPPGGRITATLRDTGAHAELSISDTGPGIPDDRIADVFGLFVQGDQDSAHSQGGLGLGLSLVRQLVELHGGDVSVFSAGVPGRGSEFVVRLPRCAEAATTPDTPAPAPATHAKRILVVDDNRDAADTLQLLLQQLGYRSQVLYDGASALAAIRASRPDAVVLDIGLPDVDGLEIARRIRAGMASPPPLIALTGYGQDSDRIAALEAGFHAHLTKPLVCEDLANLLVRILG